MEGDNVCLSQGRSEAEDMGIEKGSRVKRQEIAFKRSLVYELLSHALAEPSLEFIRFVSHGEFLDTIMDCIRPYPQGRKLNMSLLVDTVSHARKYDIETIGNLYKRLISPEHSFLHECRYHAQFSAYDEMADIAGFYRAFGFDFRGERPDHISLELEFMRILTLKEAKTLTDNSDNLDVCVSAQRSFLMSHLGRWVHLLSIVSEGIAFYGGISMFLKNWIEAECRHLLIKPEPLNEVLIRDLQEDEDSINCMIDTVSYKEE
ncbi:MAG: hypothetical protein Fur0020_06440 [Thermodesulfovibrionia bacterium]